MPEIDVDEVPTNGREPRLFGADEGMFEVPGDFDAPLPDDLQTASEGG